MIQELFGGGATLLGGGAGERKMCFSDILEGSPSPSPSPSPSFSSSCTNTITSNGGGVGGGVGGGCNTTTPTPTTDQQNLRCPRCDSSNTKFCYYNNYNLTQPRHFCKTCRRYWTKGGALRNVPIGGGCRKNKNSCTSPATATVKSSGAGKIKTGPGEFGKSNFGFDLDPPPSSNPILWNSQPSSQLMALLRATQNQNPNPNPNSVGIKEENTAPMIGSYNMMTTTTSDSTLGTTGALNARSIAVDPLGQVPVGLCNSFWRNNQHQQPQQQHHNNLLMGDAQATGIQELFQRLRSSGNYYSDHHSQSASLFSNNVIQSSSASPTIMEPSPITAAEVGYWNNPTFSWSNLSTTNGAFP